MLFLYLGVHGKVVDNTNLQVLLDRPHLMRVHILYVWLARPREGDLIGPGTPEVCPPGPSCIIGG